MVNKIYIPYLIGMLAMIIFGGFLAFNAYEKDIYPLDRARGKFYFVTASSDPLVIHNQLVEIKRELPPTGNPVFIFPTFSTDFARIQTDLDRMITSVDKISLVPKDSSAYHSGIMDIGSHSFILQKNIEEATPYMYFSVVNIMYSQIWIAAFIGIYIAFKRKKDQMNVYCRKSDL